MARLLLALPPSVPSSTSATPISSSSTQSTSSSRRRRSTICAKMVSSSVSSFLNDDKYSEYHPGPPPVFKLNPPSRQILSRKLTSQLLSPLQEKPIKTLDLSGSAFSDAACVVAGPALITLANKNCLHTVILSDIIATLSTDEACRSLSTIATSIGIHKGLRVVDLSRNAIGTMGMSHCSPLFEDQTYLERVDLHNTGISAQAARLLSQFLSTSNPTALRSLDVHANCLESEGLEYIASIVSKSTGLEKLCVSNVRAFGPAMAKLCLALANTPNMRDLDISDNGFSMEAASSLSKALKMQGNLARLMLSDLNMTTSMLTPIASALSDQRPPLRILDLGNNELDESAGPIISDLLSAIGSSLIALDVSTNELSSEGVSNLADGIARLSESAPLASVNVALNDADSLSIIKLAAALAPRTTISKFVIHGNDVPDKVCVRIASAFPPSVVEYHDNDEGNIEDGDAISTVATSAEKGESQDDKSPDDDADAEDLVDDEDDGERKLIAPGVQENDSQIESALEALETLGLARGIKEATPDLEEGTLLVSVASSEVTTSVSVPTASNDDGNPSVGSKLIAEDSGKVSEKNTSAGSKLIPGYEVDVSAESEPGAIRPVNEGANNESLDVNEDEARPSTPPPSRFIGFAASPISQLDEEGKDEGAEMDAAVASPRDEEEDGESGERNVMDSARKLKASIVSLSREISDVAGELQMTVDGAPIATSASGASGVVERNDDNGNENDTTDNNENDNENDNENENEDDVNDYLLVGEGVTSRRKHSSTMTTLILDCVGGCIIALFVIVLVLAIVQSQEEATFSYRFV